MKYEIVLGLEIHLQLNTGRKMFCSCKNNPFHGKVNAHVCPVCLGLPGAMPVPNDKAIEKSQKLAYALGSNLRDEIIFERKNYFYPDLPKAFQITTPHYPVSEKGDYHMLFADETIRWREIHIEEDTAKSQHKEGYTWINFNKSGVPLLELVTEPDFHSIEKVVQFAKEMQWFARYLDVSEASMEKGHMRLEANISMRKKGESKLPDYRVELKNINSFRFMKKALEAEIKRQTAALDKGETLTQETRGFNESKRITFSQRDKEEAHDYRYFPEPDIPPIRLQVSDIKTKNKTPRDYLDELTKAGIRDSYLPVIISDKELAEFALESIMLGKKEKLEPNQIVGEIINKKIKPEKIMPSELIESIQHSRSSVVSDESEIEKWVKQAMGENPKAVEDIKKGKMQAVGALMGSVMNYSKGKADVSKVQKLIKEKI